MYNDKDGNIIFEITPCYPWNKDYKPAVQIMIPKERLEKWLPQAKKLKKMLNLEV